MLREKKGQYKIFSNVRPDILYNELAAAVNSGMDKYINIQIRPAIAVRSPRKAEANQHAATLYVTMVDLDFFQQKNKTNHC